MRIWERFPRIFTAVKASHEEVGLVGHHDFVHAARVGEIAYQVAHVEWGDPRNALLAGAAGLCHNADRILQKQLGVGRRDVPKEQVINLVQSQLRTEVDGLRMDDFLTAREIEMIVAAVLGHDGKNQNDDSNVLIALMDADRVVNLDGDAALRCAQNYHDLRVVDYQHFLADPTANYRDPKSVLFDVAAALDWVDPASGVCVRTRLGKVLANERAGIYRMLIDGLRSQLETEGIMPYPFE